MRMIWIVLALLAGLAAGLWFAWSRGLGGEALTGPIGELQQHLAREGLDTRGSLVRRGTWEGTLQHARFTLVGGPPRGFYVVRFASNSHAEQQRAALMASPTPSLPQVRGAMLLYLPDWPAGDPATQRLIAAFHRWPMGEAGGS